jgi:2'-5' RNA ligase
MRLFVALDIPETVRAALAGLVQKLRAAHPGARWARMEGFHVTLKFIGETASENAGAIQAALASIPAQAPFSIDFRGLGFFPNDRHPRVLWAGVAASPQLTGLAAAVDATLAPLGIPREERAFSPHLTLARFKEPHGLPSLHAAIEKAKPFEFGLATAKEFHLYQSVLKRDGAEYTRLATFSFAGRDSE